jgi:hypothetical protein
LHVLCEIVASLHDHDGKVAVAGFYDGTGELTPSRRQQIASVPFDAAGYLRELGVPQPRGEPGYTALERLRLLAAGPAR